MEVFANRQFGESTLGADDRSFYAAGYPARTSPGHLYDLREQARVQNTLISPGDFALPCFHPAVGAATARHSVSPETTDEAACEFSSMRLPVGNHLLCPRGMGGDPFADSPAIQWQPLARP